MKLSRIRIGMSFGLCLLSAVAVFAADRGALHVLWPMQVDGQQVAAGDYAVYWEGNDPDLRVSIVKNAKELASARARWVTLNTVPSDDAALVENVDGVRHLTQIRFAGKKQALEIVEEYEARR